MIETGGQQTLKTVGIKINGLDVNVPEGVSLYDAIKTGAGIEIPTLCHTPGLKPQGRCGVCVVEVDGKDGRPSSLVKSCNTDITEGMSLQTHSKKAVEARGTVIDLIAKEHPVECLGCTKNNAGCALQELAAKNRVRLGKDARSPEKAAMSLDVGVSIVRDPEKCLDCGRCVQMCNEVQTVGAIDFMGRGVNQHVGTINNLSLSETNCVNCGQCTKVCPVGAVFEKDDVSVVEAAINDPTKHVVVQFAPAVRAAIGEGFGVSEVTEATGKMYAVSRRLGFDRIFDTNFSADLTIMEEGTEFIHRLTKGGTLPLITSCCPGWVRFAELEYPDLLENLSSCKSPQQMLGSLVKTYYPEKSGVNPEDIVSVSIMPCTAKKFEAKRPEMDDSGHRDVDAVLTTREFGRMIKSHGLDFTGLPEEKADSLLGEYTGAGTIFGASGGVMEAALRTVYKVVTGDELPGVDFMPARGLEGVKEAEVPVKDDLVVKVAVANGLGNARKLLDKVRSAKENGEAPPYHFIEIMACPGGCVGGGGQPEGFDMKKYAQRAQRLYQDDKANGRLRRSHENSEVQKLTEEFLEGENGGEKAHHLLHTHYTAGSVKPVK